MSRKERHRAHFSLSLPIETPHVLSPATFLKTSCCQDRAAKSARQDRSRDCPRRVGVCPIRVPSEQRLEKSERPFDQNLFLVFYTRQIKK